MEEKIYDKKIMIQHFSYHTPYQPSTYGPRADMGVGYDTKNVI